MGESPWDCKKLDRTQQRNNSNKKLPSRIFLKSLVVKLINLLRLFNFLCGQNKKKNSFFSFCLSFLLLMILLIIYYSGFVLF